MVKILVIEDQPPLLDKVLEILHLEGFEAIGAEDGLVGVQKAREYLPDLIICDVMMPKLDGYGVLLELQNSPATAAIPFVFLTARADKSDLRAGMELGADDYLTKPFRSDELLRAIRTRLEKRAALTRLSDQKLDALREQIFTTLPHELRTPLTGILGYSEMLLDDIAAYSLDEIVIYLQRVHRAAMRLYRLIENYLIYVQIGSIQQDMAKIELLRRETTTHPKADIEAWIHANARQAEREVDLALDIADTAVIHLHSEYLKKIVQELADNTFKFSSPGSPVHITARADNSTYILEFRDHGRGMTPEQIASVGAYMQFNRKLYEHQGSGMGLIIAKQLAELHNGRLTIQSDPSHGTTVQVTLPAGV